MRTPTAAAVARTDIELAFARRRRPAILSAPFCVALLASVCFAPITGCVTRQGPMPVERAALAASTAVGADADQWRVGSVPSWRDLGDSNGKPGLPPEAWPVRLPMPAQNGDGDAPLVHLILPAQRAPDRREQIGPRGLGIVQRVLVEQLTDTTSLERLQRDQGFVEWLVVQTLRSELTPVMTADGALVPGERVEPDDEGGARVESRTPRFRLFEGAETSFALYLPESSPRGLVVQMTNLAGNTGWERRMTQSFRAAGWAVLSTFMPDGWALASNQQIDATDDPEELGRRIAALVDDRLAEWAYGVEAVLEDLAIRRPELTQRPLVGIGSSVGAVAMPAVSARLERPFDALVLAAGGADTLEILRSTTMGIAASPLRWRDGRRPTTDAWRRIGAAYRDATRLDALHTARLLRGSPVLQLHADWDSIVPAATGELLWESLGRPERWRYRSGHVGLLVFWLPNESKRVVEWVDGAVSLERSSDDGS